jgi:hypothetical protein
VTLAVLLPRITKTSFFRNKNLTLVTSPSHWDQIALKIPEKEPFLTDFFFTQPICLPENIDITRDFQLLRTQNSWSQPLGLTSAYQKDILFAGNSDSASCTKSLMHGRMCGSEDFVPQMPDGHHRKVIIQDCEDLLHVRIANAQQM